MDYAERFLKRKGQIATLLSRPSVVIPGVTTYPVSRAMVSPSAKSGWRIGDRDAFWDGLILSDSALTPGEVVAVDGKTLLILSTDTDPISGQTKFTSARKNADLTWSRQSASVDADNNVIITWPTISADIPSFGQIVNAYLVQQDPGLLPTTKYLFYVPDTYVMQQMDRVVYNEKNCQVDSVDDVLLAGISRIQCSDDQRT